MRWITRIVFSVMVGIAALVISADSSNTLSGQVGRFLTPVEIWLAIGMIFLGSVYGVIDALLERHRAKRRHEIAEIVAELLFPLWHDLSELTDKDELAVRETLGVHAWLIPSWYALITRPRMRGCIPRSIRRRLPTPQLWRAAQYRLKHADEATRIKWRRGRGVIGKCWERVDIVYEDLTALWGPQELNYERWKGLPEDSKLGLNYQEYRKIRRKYGSVLAVPIRHPRGRGAPQFLGCITIDLAVGVRGRQLKLDSTDVKSLVWKSVWRIEQKLDNTA